MKFWVNKKVKKYIRFSLGYFTNIAVSIAKHYPLLCGNFQNHC